MAIYHLRVDNHLTSNVNEPVYKFLLNFISKNGNIVFYPLAADRNHKLNSRFARCSIL